MNKIGLSHIIVAHVKTLRDLESGNVSFLDIFVFYIAPFLMSVTAVWFLKQIDKNAFVLFVSVFSIFAALLINAQVAIFGISQRERPTAKDPQKEVLIIQEFKYRNLLLSELNTNISYLIFVSCLALVCFMVFYATEISGAFVIGPSIFLISHFLLTLMMVIKRSHALFQREYDRENSR